MIELLLPHMLERSKRFQSADDANEALLHKCADLRDLRRPRCRRHCQVLDVLARRLQDLAPTGDAIQSITTRKVDKLGYAPLHHICA